jgi:hypothetical protein
MPKTVKTRALAGTPAPQAEDVRPWLRDDVCHMAFVVGN